MRKRFRAVKMVAMKQGRESVDVAETILAGSRFVSACLRKPVDRTPVWFLRQAGRYMQEYRDVRKHHTLVEICKKPELAAEVVPAATHFWYCYVNISFSYICVSSEATPFITLKYGVSINPKSFTLP